MSLAPIEKPCQLMIEPGELVTWTRLPFVVIETCPLTTDAPVGFACASSVAKHDATARVMTLRRIDALRVTRVGFFITTTPGAMRSFTHNDLNCPSKKVQACRNWALRFQCRNALTATRTTSKTLTI